METSSPWKRPDEVMQLHRLKKRQKALQARMRQPAVCSTPESSENSNSIHLDFSKIIDGDKRKNPFSKFNVHNSKKLKTSYEGPGNDQTSDKTLFAVLNLPAAKTETPKPDLNTDKLTTFSNLLQKYTTDQAVEPITETKHKHLPIDWALKTKVRLMSPKPFAWNHKLKASEEASGVTGFVRCLDTTSHTLDSSQQARFHQTCLYWQHPHLPWVSLFPRTGRLSSTSFLATNEEAKAALHREWTESFRSLFQLLRARHCPYFYLCANTFTCLFRAAGLSGVSEPCALIAPTTRGFRHTLKQEDVEFSMPLRPESKRNLNNSDSKDEEKPKNSSVDSCYDTMDEVKSPTDSQPASKACADNDNDASGDEEDVVSDNFLSRLGFDSNDIKKINHSQVRQHQTVESSVDTAAESLVFIRGVEAQALFNFLLNCKSIVAPTGPFAGIPPTLLAPTAFHGGTLQSLKVRESVVYSENNKYYSIELRGPILPTTLHSLFDVLKATCTAHFSATFAHLQPTLAFSSAARVIAEDESSKENEVKRIPNAFNEQNLSDCGLSSSMLQHFCSADPSLTRSIDSIKYSADDRTYSW